MRRALLSTLAICAFMATPLQAQDAAPRTITMTGTGTTYAAPDTASINIDVSNMDKNPTLALSANKAKMTAVIEALKASGIQADSLRTDGFTIRPRKEPDPDSPDTFKFVGYEVNNSLRARLEDIDKLGAIIETVAAIEMTSISQINFYIDDTKALEDTARERAMDVAQGKAELLLKKSGGKLGKIVRIKEGFDFNDIPLMGGMAKTKTTDFPLERGVIETSAILTLTWEIE